jgi:hypothetical protein
MAKSGDNINNENNNNFLVKKNEWNVFLLKIASEYSYLLGRTILIFIVIFSLNIQYPPPNCGFAAVLSKNRSDSCPDPPDGPVEMKTKTTNDGSKKGVEEWLKMATHLDMKFSGNRGWILVK